MTTTSESLLKLANTAGFLLQLRVEREIENTYNEHGWQAVAREHYWSSSSSDGYIDIVLQHEIQHIVAECKRVQDADWVFLLSEELAGNVARARILWTDQMSDHPTLSEWSEFAVTPMSPESAFCVLRSQDRDSPMLERLSGIVLRSAEGLAEEGLRLKVYQHGDTPRVYIPIIVTTAKLHICRFDPGDINLQTGKLLEGNCEFEAVPFIRFRKGLSTRRASKRLSQDFIEANREKERTVFVVQVTELVSFLRQWKLCPKSGTKWAWTIAREQELARSASSIPKTGGPRYINRP